MKRAALLVACAGCFGYSEPPPERPAPALRKIGDAKILEAIAMAGVACSPVRNTSVCLRGGGVGDSRPTNRPVEQPAQPCPLGRPKLRDVACGCLTGLSDAAVMRCCV